MKLYDFLSQAETETLRRLYYFLDFSELQQVLKVNRLRNGWIKKLQITSLQIDLGDFQSVTNDDFYKNIHYLTIRNDYRMLWSNPFDKTMNEILTQTTNLKFLDVSFNRSLTDGHLEILFSSGAHHLEKLNFACSPLITKQTLSNLLRYKVNFKEIAFTIPEIDFSVLFDLFEQNPSATYFIPNYIYEQNQLSLLYKNINIQQRYGYYGLLVDMITEENLAQVSDDQLKTWVLLPCITQTTIKKKDHPEELDTAEPKIWAAVAGNSMHFFTLLILEGKYEQFKVSLG
jgi:hypothetical protein